MSSYQSFPKTLLLLGLFKTSPLRVDLKTYFVYFFKITFLFLNVLYLEKNPREATLGDRTSDKSKSSAGMGTAHPGLWTDRIFYNIYSPSGCSL